MIRRHMTLLRLALVLADATSAVLVFALVAVVRFHYLDPRSTFNIGGLEPLTVAAVYGALWVASLWLLGLYRLRTHWTLRGETIDVLRATALMAAASLSALFLFKLPDLSRVFLLLLFLSQPVVTIASRAALRFCFARMRSRGYSSRQMLIIGAGPAAEAFANEVEGNRALGLRVVGHLAGPRDEASAVHRPVIGSIDQIEEVLHGAVVDEVAICLTPEDWRFIEPATRICEEEGKIVRVAIGTLGGALAGGRYEELAGTPIVTFLYGPDRVVSLLAKRLVDIVLAGLALAVLSPLIGGLALYLRLLQGPPVLFRQVRVGLHGRPFSCLKFRTMTPDAEERYAHLAARSDTRGPAFKMSRDPRVTSVGRFLRLTSLDELPQLVNVLRGEMSIVGPRPAPPREVVGYSVWHRRRLSMKPGMTGLWQVEARRDEDFDRRASLDLAYIDRWSLWLDLKIMLRTIPAVLQGR